MNKKTASAFRSRHIPIGLLLLGIAANVGVVFYVSLYFNRRATIKKCFERAVQQARNAWDENTELYQKNRQFFEENNLDLRILLPTSHIDTASIYKAAYDACVRGNGFDS